MSVQIVIKPIDELKPYKRNPRRNDQAVDAVAASIKEFGFKVPIVIDKDSEIVAGHTRLKAAYETIFTKAIAKVKDNGFIAVVVGEVRDDNGIYRNFIGDTIEAVKRAGAQYYNEIVLVTMLGTLPVRIRRQFEASRKVGNTHQKALIFFKSAAEQKNIDAALKDYMEDFTDTRILTPMKKSILVFLKGKQPKKEEIEGYKFDEF